MKCIEIVNMRVSQVTFDTSSICVIFRIFIIDCVSMFLKNRLTKRNKPAPK